MRQDKAFVVPENADPRQAALSEPLAFSVHTMKLAEMREGLKVLILGAGTIGQLISRMTRLHGAGYIAVTDLYESKLELARNQGFDQTIQVKNSTTIEDILRQVGKHSVDVVFDCVADETSMDWSVQVVKKGGKILVVGVGGRKITPDVGLIMFNELKLIGCMMYNNGDFADAVRILGEGKLDLSPFVSKVFKLRNVGAAFDEIIENKDRYVKCLVEP